jgi:hypothetical protein
VFISGWLESGGSLWILLDKFIDLLGQRDLD